MTDNPFSAPVNVQNHEPAPRRDPLAALSDRELNRLLQQYRDRFAWCAYLGLIAMASDFLAFLPNMKMPLRILFFLIGMWLTATVVLMFRGKPAGRIMAFFSFGLMVLSGLNSFAMGNIGGLVGTALAVAGIKHAYDTKALYDATVPTRKALKMEKKRRKQMARP